MAAHTNWMLWIGLAIACVSCLISMVTSIIALDCSTKGKWGCAGPAGITATVFGCAISSLVALVLFGGHKTSSNI